MKRGKKEKIGIEKKIVGGGGEGGLVKIADGSEKWPSKEVKAKGSNQKDV